MCVLSCFSYVWLFVSPWTVAHQAPLSMGFSGHNNEWAANAAGDLPDPGIESFLAYPALQTDSLPTEPPGKPSVQLKFK